MPANRAFASFVKRFDPAPAHEGDFGVNPVKTLADFTPEERQKLCDELRAPLSPNAPAYRPREAKPVVTHSSPLDAAGYPPMEPEPGPLNSPSGGAT